MHSLIQAVLQATFVSKCVLILLLFMSVASWAYMCGKWLSLRQARRRVDEGLKAFFMSEDLSKALPVIAADEISPLYTITERAITEYNRLAKTGDIDRLIDANMRRTLRFAVSEEMEKLKSSLGLLATTGNTAPFIGLFGTVWGIMHSFSAIAEMKSVSLATVAPGIAEALVATAVGLFVAIPAVFGFNTFKTILYQIESACNNFSGQLLNRMQHESPQYTNGFLFE